jgi:hypothetical protein
MATPFRQNALVTSSTVSRLDLHQFGGSNRYFSPTKQGDTWTAHWRRSRDAFRYCRLHGLGERQGRHHRDCVGRRNAEARRNPPGD